jgi:ArsR family transcriptional regulator
MAAASTPMTHTDAVKALAALAHDARLAVFKLLVQAGPDGVAAGVLAEQLALAPSALSFHLKELTHTGLLVQRPDGRRLMYSANFNTMNELLSHLTENCCQGVPCTVDAPTVCCPVPASSRLQLDGDAPPATDTTGSTGAAPQSKEPA